MCLSSLAGLGVNKSFAWELVMFFSLICVLHMHILRRQCHMLVNHVHFGSSILVGMQSLCIIVLKTHPPIPMLIATKSCPDNQDAGD
jgi:hypothetical protein